MTVIKHGNTILGAHLTAKERKALEIEMRKQIAEYDKKNIAEIDAMVLWVLHEQLGLGKKALRKFYDSFHGHLDRLVSHYEMEKEDEAWLCTEMLKTIGVDIVAWHEETVDKEDNKDA